MRTIGLIGGLSWESSAIYYRLINTEVARRLGGLHSAQSVLYSFDFAEIEALQHQGRWDQATDRMVDAAQRVERAGAEFLVICSNTMHVMADAVQDAIGIPLLHIADTTAAAARERGLATVGLLATAFTMEMDFYAGRLSQRHGIQVLVPPAGQRELVHRVIYDELCQGKVLEPSRRAYREIIADLADGGAEGILLGCTELGMLIGADDSPVPVFDTTELHARAAVDLALRAAEEQGLRTAT